MSNCIRVETAAQAVVLFRAAFPKDQKEGLVFVLPLDEGGYEVSAKATSQCVLPLRCGDFTSMAGCCG